MGLPIELKWASLADARERPPTESSQSAGTIVEIVSCVKQSEDGEDLIVRAYETLGEKCRTEINIPMLGRRWIGQFGPCEIKTLRIPKSADLAISEANLIEG